MKKKAIPSKPRNHVVMAMTKRNGAGAHQTTNKALRQQQKMALKRQETDQVSFFMGATTALARHMQHAYS